MSTICGVCTCELVSDTDLYNHVNVTHVDTWTKGVLCKWYGCTYTSVSISKMRVHMRTHTGERSFKCNYELCGKSFYTPEKLKEHERVHSGYRPFVCEICNKTFSYAGNLSRHKHTHIGDRKFKCSYCNLSLTSKGNLLRHELIHKGLRPYKCEHYGCTISCLTASDLKRHARTHTGERPYKCSSCDVTFTLLYNLRVHEYMHTVPVCVICMNRPITRDSRMCGYCNLSKGGQFNVKENTVFEFLANADWRLSHFVRDQQLGCGVRVRPDGYVDLVVTSGDGRVLFVLEIDETFHRRISPSCELERLEKIQNRHGGPLYVLRYNPDQDGGLDVECLSKLADRCLDIIDGEFENAVNAFGGMIIEYIGYPEKRVGVLDRIWFEQQSNINVKRKHDDVPEDEDVTDDDDVTSLKRRRPDADPGDVAGQDDDVAEATDKIQT